MRRYRTQLTGPAGAPWLNTFYMDEILGSSAQDLATAVGVFWNTIKPLISTAVTITGQNIVTTMTEATGQPTDEESVSGFTYVGGDGGQVLPWQTQAVINWRTGTWVGGRQVVGRTFIPGLITSSTSGGAPSSSLVAGLQSAADALIASDGAISVWSRKHGQTYSVTSAQIDPRWAYLSSRRD